MRFTPPSADDWLDRLRLVVEWSDIAGFKEAISPPVIILGRRQSQRQQRWLVFHAIGHVQLHRGNQLAMLRDGRRLDVRKQERQAECWAARTLVPGAVFLCAIKEGLEGDDLCDLFDVPASRLEYALRMYGVEGFEGRPTVPIPLHRRTLTVPSVDEMENYLKHKDEIDQAARRSGWRPGS